MNRIKTIAVTIVMALVLHGLTPEWADACPTCKLDLQQGHGLGYAISILFLISLPFVILSFWAATIVRLRAKIRASSP